MTRAIAVVADAGPSMSRTDADALHAKARGAAAIHKAIAAYPAAFERKPDDSALLDALADAHIPY